MELKHKLIYNYLKDKTHKGTKDLQHKYLVLSHNDYTGLREVITAIRNYQIKKYGSELCESGYYVDKKQAQLKAKQRKWQRFKTKEYY